MLRLYTHRFVPPGTIIEHRPGGTVHRVEKGRPFVDELARVKIIARIPAKEITRCRKPTA